MKLKVGQVGIGTWGQYHCKLLSEIGEIEFAGIFDINSERAEEFSGLFNVKKYDKLNILIGDLDALIITTPTMQHYEIAQLALNNNLHTFVEKPICTSVQQAHSLTKTAQEKKLILQVGHIERFNPAFLSLKQEKLQPLFIECQRLTPFSPRCTDVSVVLDLMIHDIDLVLNLVGNPIKNISATGLALVTDKIDFANARIEFESGTIADLTASRIAENKKRTMAVYQRDANYQLNFIDRSAFKMSHDIRQHQFSVPEENGINNFQSTKNNSNGYKSQLSSPNQAENNLLSLELNSFIDAIQKNGQPYVNGLAGTQALEVAFEIMDKIENCHYPVNHTANLINT